jgi:hypothetical protein
MLDVYKRSRKPGKAKGFASEFVLIKVLKLQDTQNITETKKLCKSLNNRGAIVPLPGGLPSQSCDLPFSSILILSVFFFLSFRVNALHVERAVIYARMERKTDS